MLKVWLVQMRPVASQSTLVQKHVGIQYCSSAIAGLLFFGKQVNHRMAAIHRHCLIAPLLGCLMGTL